MIDGYHILFWYSLPFKNDHMLITQNNGFHYDIFIYVMNIIFTLIMVIPFIVLSYLSSHFCFSFSSL